MGPNDLFWFGPCFWRVLNLKIGDKNAPGMEDFFSEFGGN